MSSPFIYTRAFPRRGALMFCGLRGSGLGEHLVPSDALHVVDLLGVLLDPGHQLRLVVRLERPAAFAFDAFLHSAPPREIRPAPKIIAGRLWRMFGGSLLRIYLTGEVAVERGDQLLRDADLPGRQGRLALVYLVAERERAGTQAEVAGLLWPDSVPASGHGALR